MFSKVFVYFGEYSGARYCALVGDFNGWSPRENCAREGHLGHDDYGYWFIILEDKLREGEEPDELYFQQYNYVDDYDKGDSGVSIEEIFQKANDEYWEPGEDEYIKNRFKVPAKLYEQWFGPNGPETEEELDAIPLPDAETRYKAWKEQHKDDPPSNLPPCDVIDKGKEYDIYNVISDPAWLEKIRAKQPPLPYWFETRKGRQAWLKKYTPAIPHKSKYRVYFNTPNGPLERVPAWATYVQPGKLTSFESNLLHSWHFVYHYILLNHFSSSIMAIIFSITIHLFHLNLVIIARHRWETTFCYPLGTTPRSCLQMEKHSPKSAEVIEDI